jgi:hypothetical protein
MFLKFFCVAGFGFYFLLKLHFDALHMHNFAITMDQFVVVSCGAVIIAANPENKQQPAQEPRACRPWSSPKRPEV